MSRRVASANGGACGVSGSGRSSVNASVGNERLGRHDPPPYGPLSIVLLRILHHLLASVTVGLG